MQPVEATSPDRATLAAFAGAVLIGGTNFVAVKFSNDELDPMFGAGIRFAAAALILFAVMRLRGMAIPRGHELKGALVYGLLGFGAAYAGLYYALVGLKSGTASVFVASTPLVTLILAALHRQERFTTRGVIGGLLAIAGITVISIDSLGGDLRPIYVISALAGVVAVAESSVLIKNYPKAHPITTNAIAMLAGAFLLFAASLVFREEWVLPQTARTWVVLGWLVAAGSVALFILFLYVIMRWTASATVYALTLMPVVAIALGALLADEEITAQLLIGGGLVIAAVYVGALSGRKPAPSRTTLPEGQAAAEAAPS